VESCSVIARPALQERLNNDGFWPIAALISALFPREAVVEIISIPPALRDD
jgi:hypothetical protein